MIFRLTLMMIITLQGWVYFIFYFNRVRCSIEQMSTQKNQKEFTELLSFSFDKESFEDFQCNFYNQILSHSSLKQKPFYYSKPVKNLLSTFCLFFQFSQINNNEDFRFLVENLFKTNQRNINSLTSITNEFKYDPQTFIYQIEKFCNEIDRMIAENGNDIVYINEKNGRIFVTQNNNSSSDFSPHFFKNFLDLKLDTSGNEKVKNAMIKFYTKFEEMHLSDALKPGFYEPLNYIYNSERKKVRDEIGLKPRASEEFENELEETFKNFCYLLNIDVKTKNNEILNFSSNYKKHLYLYVKMFFCGELPVYLNDISLKGRAKYFFDYPANQALFYGFFDTNLMEKDIVLDFKKLIKIVLSNPDKINYGNSILSQESLDNLVKNCLELVV